MGKLFFEECVNDFTFTIPGLCLARDKYPCSCSKEIGATAGVMICVVVVAIIPVIILIVGG